MTKLLKVGEMAEKLNISRATLYRLKDTGLPFVKVGGSIRFDEEKVLQWISEQNK